MEKSNHKQEKMEVPETLKFHHPRKDPRFLSSHPSLCLLSIDPAEHCNQHGHAVGGVFGEFCLIPWYFGMIMFPLASLAGETIGTGFNGPVQASAIIPTPHVSCTKLAGDERLFSHAALIPSFQFLIYSRHG
jgi:hypothetical protein